MSRSSCHPDREAARHVSDELLSREAARLTAFIEQHPRLLVLTGAGISVESGIPDYRDGSGQWKRPQPVNYQAFSSSDRVRRRYWARATVGWPHFVAARPNRAHSALAGLEAAGTVACVVTQNVDGLHQQAGSQQVIDLHGRLDRVVCLDCGARHCRHAFQRQLAARNPDFATLRATQAPDGDADLEGAAFDAFDVPACRDCGGVLKPDVVFFGEGVPRQRIDAVLDRLQRADALLVVGSSLMVYSGYRYCQAAHKLGKPIAAVNLGRTRADDFFSLKISAPCGPTLAEVAQHLASR